MGKPQVTNWFLAYLRSGRPSGSDTSLFLNGFPNLNTALHIAFIREQKTAEPLDRLIFLQGRLCAEEFNEILLLCGNGYGVAALRLVRGMFERIVTARYLSEHPEELDDYLDYHWISERKFLIAVEDTFGSKLVGKEKEEEVENNYKNVKARYMVTDCKKCGTKRLNHTWSKLNFVAMANAAGELGKLIIPAYYMPTKEIHSTIGAVLTRLDKNADGLVFDGGAQRKRADDALMSAHNLILNCLKLQQTYFNLEGLTVPLDICYADFLEIWGKQES